VDVPVVQRFRLIDETVEFGDDPAILADRVSIGIQI
jgi:hypothetical protein